MFCSWQPDLVVTDIHMPDVTGLNVIDEIRGLKPTAPIVAISAGDLLEEARKRGAARTFQKPINFYDFTFGVWELLNPEPDSMDI